MDVDAAREPKRRPRRRPRFASRPSHGVGTRRVRAGETLKEPGLANPWTKRNPFLSLWLSSANRVAGKARAAATAAAKRQQTQLVRQAARNWTAAWTAALKPKRRR